MEQSNEASIHKSAVSNRNDACEINDPNDSEDNSLFIKSMTFTSVIARCDCDECCVEGGIKRSLPQIPQAIGLAVQNYKRTKRAEVLVKRSQARTLIGRSTLLKDLAVWELTIPSLAEPLIEYGNPLVYRIIWVRRLHKNLLLKRIGCGIIGSKNEEHGRQQLDWMENDVIVVSSKDQKAVGYIVEPAKLDDDIIDVKDAPPGPVVLYVAKIPSELLVYDDDNETHFDDNSLTTNASSPSSPFEMIRRICSRAIRSWSDSKDKENSIRLDPSDQTLFRETITAMIKS
jgi:hypothetical protein